MSMSEVCPPSISTFIKRNEIFYKDVHTFPQIFAIIASMEFVYREAPQYMKSFGMGIYFAVLTLGDTFAVSCLSVPI